MKDFIVNASLSVAVAATDYFVVPFLISSGASSAFELGVVVIVVSLAWFGFCAACLYEAITKKVKLWSSQQKIK